jgi:hydrogenase maturation factor
VIVPEEEAAQALAAMRAHPLGGAASIIGSAMAGEPGLVIGGRSRRAQPSTSWRKPPGAERWRA